jgi:sulfoxide reductase catalytic subunit YedY
MLVRKSNRFDANIRSSDITPKDAKDAFERYQQDRRRFLTGAAALGAGAIAATHLPSLLNPQAVHAADKLQTIPSKYTTSETQTPFNTATNYNNFYEFGTDKSDPAKNAHTLRPRPWTVQVPAWSRSLRPSISTAS